MKHIKNIYKLVRNKYKIFYIDIDSPFYVNTYIIKTDWGIFESRDSNILFCAHKYLTYSISTQLTLNIFKKIVYKCTMNNHNIILRNNITFIEKIVNVFYRMKRYWIISYCQHKFNIIMLILLIVMCFYNKFNK